MKQICLFLLLLFALKFCAAQTLNLAVTRMIGGYNRTGLGNLLYDERDKSILFFGSADSCGSGDLVPKAGYLSGSASQGHFVFGKVDSNHNLVWVKMYGSSTGYGEGARCGRIMSTPTGGYIIAGNTFSNDGDVSGNHSPGGYDTWLLRLDSNGNKLWQRCLGGMYNDIPLDCRPTSDGGAIVISYTNSPTSGDVPFTYVNSQFTFDWLVIKVDSMGNKQWAKTMGGTGDDGNAFIFEVDSAYYITGASESRNHECNDTSWRAGINSGEDFFLIKLDRNGNYLWNKCYGSAQSERLSGATWDERDSTFVMVGFTSVGGNMVPPSPQLKGKTWVLKVDKSGTIKWSKVIGDTSAVSNEFQSISNIPLAKGYIIAAQTLPFNSNNTPPDYFGRHDVHVFLIDSLGSVITDKKIGGTGSETYPQAIACNNGFVVGGSTESSRFNEGTSNSLRGKLDIYLSFLDYWPLGISNLAPQENNVITAFPNPAENEFTVEIATQVPTKGRLQITTMDGKEVYRGATSPDRRSYAVPTASWAKGIYLINWINKAEKIYTKKIVIQ